MKKRTYSDVFLDSKYKLIVLDMDGTLYYQRSMQFLMCLEMGVYGIMHPFSLWKWKVIGLFRKIREQEASSCVGEIGGAINEEDSIQKEKCLLEWQYKITAEKVGRGKEQIQDVVEEWMFKRPLKYLLYLRDVKLCEWIKCWRNEGKKVVIFSDYPAVDKCNALEIEADAVYSSDEASIGEMKPSPKGIKVISRDFDVAPNQILIVGDRMSKDGEMAKNAGADYLILKKWKIIRNLHY